MGGGINMVQDHNLLDVSEATIKDLQGRGCLEAKLFPCLVKAY